MSILKNIKDWITDLIGLAIMLASSYFYFWEKAIEQSAWITCLCIGFILFWVPDDVILRHIKKKVNDKTKIE